MPTHTYMHTHVCVCDLLYLLEDNYNYLIFPTPHHIQPRVASSDSDSDGSDHIYDIPPNREDVLNKLITEGVSGHTNKINKVTNSWRDLCLCTALYESSK